MQTCQSDEVVAISITTRNRPEMLEYCLLHFKSFKPFNTEIIVVSDDASDIEQAKKNDEICRRYNVFYIYNSTRLGIAKNKNVTIDYLNTFDYDYLFLFDDDCFPQRHNWDLPFINLSKVSEIHHSMYLVPVGELNAISKTITYDVYDNCSGFCLFFTRKAINALKGMNPKFGIYGFEHAELSNRAFKEGFTNKAGKYICPTQAKDFLFSYDMDYGWLKKQSPLGAFNSDFTSSIENERPLINGYIEYNRKIFLNT
jgi:GT2 family glycosyltransferase